MVKIFDADLVKDHFIINDDGNMYPSSPFQVLASIF